jgi:hypothetical protein
VTLSTIDDAAGNSSIENLIVSAREVGALARAWRDAHAAAVHVSLIWDAVSTMYGQHALGLEPKGQY